MVINFEFTTGNGVLGITFDVSAKVSYCVVNAIKKRVNGSGAERNKDAPSANRNVLNAFVLGRSFLWSKNKFEPTKIPWETPYMSYPCCSLLIFTQVNWWLSLAASYIHVCPLNSESLRLCFQNGVIDCIKWFAITANALHETIFCEFCWNTWTDILQIISAGEGFFWTEAMLV